MPAWKCLFAAALLLPAVVCGADHVTLTTGEWRPYMSESFPHYGAIPRIVSAAFALEGVTVKYEFRPWRRAYLEASDGAAHGSIVWSASQRDTDRRRRFLFSDVVFEGQSVFFHLKSYPFSWQGLRQLHGVTVGGTMGYEYFFDKDPAIQVDRSAPSDEMNFRKLLAKRFQVFPANLDVGLYFMRSELTPGEAELLSWDPQPYNITRYHLILNKKNPASRDLLTRFNRGLARLKASGRYQQYMNELHAAAPPDAEAH